MSRTTTVDTVPAGEVSVAGASRPDPFIKRGTPQFMRVTRAVLRRSGHLCPALLCAADPAGAVERVWRVAGQQQYFAFNFHGDVGGGLAVYRPAVGRYRPQAGDGHRPAAGRLLFTVIDYDDQLARHPDYARSHRPVAERRSGGRHDLSERGDPPQFRRLSMGLYISGNSIGGMSGRLLTGVFTDFFGWRVALAAISGFALAAAIMFWRILPESRHFRPTSLRPKTLLINFRLHWRDRGLPLLFIEGFLLMGAFVTLFNYIGYRLMMSPWSLSRAVVGLLSVAYLTGTQVHRRRGHDRTLWPRAGDAWLYSGDALRPAADALFFPVAYFHRHAAVFRWLLRRAFRRQQLDWPTRPPRPRSGVIAVFVQLLFGFKSCRDVRRGILASLRLERRRWVYRAAAPCRAVDRHLLTSATEIVACDVACGPRFTTSPLWKTSPSAL